MDYSDDYDLEETDDSGSALGSLSSSILNSLTQVASTAIAVNENSGINNTIPNVPVGYVSAPPSNSGLLTFIFLGLIAIVLWKIL